VRLEIARKQTEKHNRRLRDLQNEQQKLLQLFYRDGVCKSSRSASRPERTQARRWITSVTHETERRSRRLSTRRWRSFRAATRPISKLIRSYAA
jgi:hypothetical protein